MLKEDEQMALDKQKLTMFSMAVALIIAVVYIGMSEYQKMLAAEEDTKIAEQNSIYQQGMNQGYQLAVLQLLQQASTCQSVPVTANNVTLNLIAVECLQQPAAD
jgi:hypothetical protein